MRFRVIDIETTGLEPPAAEIIEIGRVDVVVDDSFGMVTSIEPPRTRLYRPLNGIPPETKAVHHLTESDFPATMSECTAELLRSAIWSGERPDYLVAHNCDFERKFIREAATDALPWICTYKVALRVWPEAPSHKNQVLRYSRMLNVGSEHSMPPHRAGPDAWVTAHILGDLIAVTSLLGTATVRDAADWTGEPALLPSIPFGKHFGKSWGDVPMDYLHWMVGAVEMDVDRVWNAQREIERRKAA